MPIKNTFRLTGYRWKNISIVIDPAKNQQMGAETGRLVIAKTLNSDSHHGTEPKTTPKPLLADDGSACKSVSREIVKPANLSLIAQATLARELNSTSLAKQDNHLAIASNNHLASNHIVYTGAIWPTQPTLSHSPIYHLKLNYIIPSPNGKVLITLIFIRLLIIIFNLWHQTARVMMILQRHSNERPLPLLLSWSGKSCITRMTYSIVMTNRMMNHHEG